MDKTDRDQEVLYKRVCRMAILARCNPDMPEFVRAYWRDVDALKSMRKDETVQDTTDQ